MKRYIIHKSPLKDDFLSVNRHVLGEALGKLKKPTAIKMYLYFTQHQDKVEWDLNVVAVAHWLGLDYSNESTARKVRNWVKEGITELEELGFITLIKDNTYSFTDKIFPENNDSKLDIKYPEIKDDKMDKILPEQ